MKIIEKIFETLFTLTIAIGIGGGIAFSIIFFTPKPAAWDATSYQKARATEKCEEEGFYGWATLNQNGVVTCAYKIPMESQILPVDAFSRSVIKLSAAYISEDIAYYDHDGIEWTPDMERMVRAFYGRDRECTFRDTGFTCDAIK